ncbi:MAG TPA: hypothetical protein VJZ27_15875 [Aggregatilineales bacterium]|nr:hypothetical protein [Aggregatilineales bacterium]
MRRLLFFNLILIIVLAACREQDPLLKDPVRNNADAPIFEPTQSTIVPGCNTGEFEQWYENTSVNAQSFRDESFGFMTLSADAASGAIFRLSDLRDQINTVAVPECMAQITGTMQEMMDSTITAFVAYNEIQIDQGVLIERITQQHQRYDTVIKPAFDDALNNLNTRLESEG